MKNFSHWLRRIGGFLGLSALFAILYAQSPLFTSNQNQYFLHGLAQAGWGDLQRDWLAQTADPTPLFSAWVRLTFQATHSTLPFYFFYAWLMGVYAVSVFSIADSTLGAAQTPQRRRAFWVIFFTLHSAALRFALSLGLGAEGTFLLEGGLANQRILGQVFQPSVFGVFLALSVALFLRRRLVWAVVALAVSIWFHATYLLAGALLTTAYLWIVWREGRSIRQVFALGGLVLLLALPSAWYTWFLAQPALPEISAQAQKILAHVRIPLHALPAVWVNWTTPVQLTCLALGMVVVRRTRLFPVIAIPALGALILTGVQAATQSDALALLFPWRISVLLLPLGAVLFWVWGAYRALDGLAARGVNFTHSGMIFAMVWVALLMAVGGIRFGVEQTRQGQAPSQGVIAYVQSHPEPGAVYAVPTHLQEFRLAAGAPVFVDAKSIPYRSGDVLEWRRRVRLVRDLEDTSLGVCQTAESLAAEGVTHFVLPGKHPAAACESLRQVYADASFGLYRFQR